jgi:hypothetical protein
MRTKSRPLIAVHADPMQRHIADMEVDQWVRAPGIPSLGVTCVVADETQF